ncbi:transcriptional regulator, partial [Bacillus mycoides]|uniref:transcriptional regulator n=1 Tax=Bacillus mycoides TaxID=1405 RepID=UPI0011A1C631
TPKHRISQPDLRKAIHSSRQTITLIHPAHYPPSILLSLNIPQLFTLPLEHIFMLIQAQEEDPQ